MTVRRGMRGRIDGFVTWQKRLLDCEVEGDYNCGRLSTLPAPNPFFTGPGGSHRSDFSGFANTTDATVTNLIQIPIFDDSVFIVHTRVTAFRTDGSNEGGFEGIAVFSRRSAGSAVLTGFSLVASVHNIGGTAAIGAAVSGNNGFITVTGRASRNISWDGEACVLQGF